MSTDSHLALEQVVLKAATERTFRLPPWAFFRVHTGVGYLLSQGLAQALNPDDLVVGGGGETVFRASQIGDLQLHYFDLSTDLLCGLLTLPESEALRAAAHAKPPLLRHLPATHPAAEPFRKLSESFHAESEASNLTARCRMLQIMAVALAEEMRDTLPTLPGTQPAALRFRELIHKKTEADLVAHSPRELAQLCGCSERHLNRLFRHFFGQSLRDRQIELRLQRARLLLLEPRSNVSRVALASGFRHLSLFNSLFKRRFGMTPSELRERSWRAPNEQNGAQPPPETRAAQ